MPPSAGDLAPNLLRYIRQRILLDIAGNDKGIAAIVPVGEFEVTPAFHLDGAGFSIVAQDTEGDRQTLRARVQQVRNRLAVNNQHAGAGKRQARGSQIGYGDLAIQPVAEPGLDVVRLIGRHFGQMTGFV